MSEGKTAEQAYEEWQDLTKQHLTPPDLWEYERVAFLAGWAARTQATGPTTQLTDESALDERLTNLLSVCDAYARGDELTSQQIDRFHTLADMPTVRWLIRTVRGMTGHRNSLEEQLAAALARNAELTEMNRQCGIANRLVADELLALRAELDNLRNRVTTLADEWEATAPPAPLSTSGRAEHIAISMCATFLRAAIDGNTNEGGKSE